MKQSLCQYCSSCFRTRLQYPSHSSQVTEMIALVVRTCNACRENPPSTLFSRMMCFTFALANSIGLNSHIYRMVNEHNFTTMLLQHLVHPINFFLLLLLLVPEKSFSHLHITRYSPSCKPSNYLFTSHFVGMQGGMKYSTLHKRQSSIQSDKYQASHRYSCFS